MSAFTFPLALVDFLDLLPIASLSIDNPEQVEINGTGGGEILTAELAPRLWQGKITLGRMTRSEAAQAAALIDLVRGPARSFIVSDKTKPWPQSDPVGALLAGFTPSILALNTDSRQLKLNGLPIGYVLTRGDYLSFQYGVSPTRYALHRIVSLSVTADVLGATPYFEITPNIRPGATVTAAVSLISSVCKAVLEPGASNTGASRRTITDGASFNFVQTLR